ncbi:tRNA-guanine transglycosylase [Thozetella sp. PMI_491]|nr:tRNA-guanine transglycosylase [Thozetella sp. PMI_491]
MDETEQPGVMTFEILEATAGDIAARLGRLTLRGHRAVATPSFFGMTSRGVLPHLTPDNLSKHTQISGAYYALEDFIERRQYAPKKGPPIFLTPTTQQNKKKLQAFTATPSPIISVLGARRLQRVAAGGNTQKAVSIFTSTGAQTLTIDDYLRAVLDLQPDIAIPLSDLTETTSTPTPKRALRMAERTDEWINDWFDSLSGDDGLAASDISTFAPLLPVPYPIQWEYIEHLSEDYSHLVKGLAVYDVDIIPELGRYPNLVPLPRLSLDAPATPHHVLRQISLGVDVFLLPFLNAASDAGIALSFSFPPPEQLSTGGGRVEPLGIDLSSEEHRASLTPLQPGCGCYACTQHHRAFVNHLLNAREMLGWTLLQMHNHAVADAFFAAVRAALAEGTATFAAAVDRFSATYDPELPPGTGTRPRARGYQFKSVGGDEKINKPAFRARLKDDDLDSKSPEDVDMIETPLVPQEDAAVLDQKGFAEIQKP